MKKSLTTKNQSKNITEIISKDEAILLEFIGVTASKQFLIEGYSENIIQMLMYNIDIKSFESIFKNNITKYKIAGVPATKMNNLIIYRKILSIIDDYENSVISKTDKKVINLLNATIEKFKDKSFSIISKIELLGEIFELSYSEKVIIQLLYAIKKFDIDNFDLNIDNMYASNSTRLIELLLNTDAESILEYFSPTNNLVKFNLIEGPYIEIADSAYNFLRNKNQISLMESMCTIETTDYDLDDFHLDEIDKQLTLSLLKNNPQAKILIVGESGSGKTTFATSLALKSGFRPLFLKDNDDYNLAINGSNNNEEIVIIDEADDILRDSRMHFVKDTNKTSFNKSIDKLTNHCIFIANSTDEVHDSILRRFDYILEFKELTRDQKIEQWNSNVPNLSKLFNEEEVGDLIYKYQVSIGIVANAINNSFSITKKKKERIQFFHAIMESHNKFRNNIFGNEEDYEVDLKNVENYNLDLVNTDVPIDNILKYMTSYKNHKKNGNPFRCSLLFQGLPGTGKTEFARYLANSVGMKSYTVRVSNLLGPFVGQTEMNVKNIFEKAKQENLVLIFDELDSFLYNRVHARENYEVTQVNEFLSQLDSYKGIIIGTTNYSDKFDKAALRRFTWKVNFKAIAKEKRMSAINAFMPDIDFTEYKNEIDNMDKITPGDLLVISEKYKYLEGVNAKDIINALKLEFQYKLEKNEKSSAIGF